MVIRESMHDIKKVRKPPAGITKYLCSAVSAVLLGVIFFSGARDAHADLTRVTNPNAIYLEMFGRGMLFDAGFDRVINEDLAAGMSFGKVGTQTMAGVDTDIKATLIPVYLNYYLTRDQGSVYLTVGATLVGNTSDVQDLKSNLGDLEFPSYSVLATLGVGYENRGDNGFLFRLAGYGIIGKKIAPWFGVTFGYSF